MTTTELVIGSYTASWIITGLYFWLSYLDVRTTLRNMAQAHDIEGNPDMVPYVKRGDFWLMVRGKLKNKFYTPLLAPFLPPFAVVPLIDMYSIYKAIRGNEQLANKQHIRGDASIK